MEKQFHHKLTGKNRRQFGTVQHDCGVDLFKKFKKKGRKTSKNDFWKTLDGEERSGEKYFKQRATCAN